MDTGSDKAWFDGVALLNLGLAKRRRGEEREAQKLFIQASERYAAQQLQLEQPREWQYLLDYFGTLCKWQATREGRVWEEILEEIRENANGQQSDLLRQLVATIQLMQRYSEDSNVRHEAIELVKGGVSRTFLAVLLLE